EEARLIAQPLLKQLLHAFLLRIHPPVETSEADLHFAPQVGDIDPQASHIRPQARHSCPQISHISAAHVHALHPPNEVASRLRAKRLLKFFVEDSVSLPRSLSRR